MEIKDHNKKALLVGSVLLILAAIWAHKENAPDTEVFYVTEDTVVVESDTDLYEAIKNPVVTTIHLGRDITLSSQVVSDYVINAAKNALVIDGKNPYAEKESDREIIHTMRDYTSDSTAFALRLQDNGSLTEITIRNLDIISQNHYGIIYVSAVGVTQYYENIIYIGPQLCHNIYGKAVFRDCDITLKKSEVSPAGEAAETAWIELDGKIRIVQETSNANEIFYMKSNSYFDSKLVVKEGAEVDITHNQARDGGLIYSERDKYEIRVEKNSSFTFHGYGFVLENLVPDLIWIQEGASFEIDLVTTAVRIALKTYELQVDDGAVFGISAGNSAENFALLGITGGTARFHNPASVYLKTENPRNDIYLLIGSAGAVLDLKVQQLNYWTSVQEGGIEALPNYHWQRKGEPLTVEADLGLYGRWNNLVTNYVYEEDMVEDSWLNAGELDSSNFLPYTAKMISFGYLPLTSGYIHGDPGEVSGETNPEAQVAVREREAVDEVLGKSIAGKDGSYTVTIPTVLERESLAALSSWKYLYQENFFIAELPSYRIYYDGNGASGGQAPVDELDYKAGSEAAVMGPGDLLRSGYRFEGWNIRPDGSGMTYQPGTYLEIESDITLYAIWEEIKIDFSFTKMKEGSDEVYLKGVEFSLYSCPYAGIEGHVHSQLAGNGEDNCWELYQKESSDDSGTVLFPGLIRGDYQLAETKTLPGYELPKGQWRLTVDTLTEDSITITASGEQSPPAFEKLPDGSLRLSNEEILILPFVGGEGVEKYCYLGFALIGSGIILLILGIRRMEEKG